MKWLLRQSIAPATAEEIEERRKRVCEKLREILSLANVRDQAEELREKHLRSLSVINYELEECEPEERERLHTKLLWMKYREHKSCRVTEDTKERL